MAAAGDDDDSDGDDDDDDDRNELTPLHLAAFTGDVDKAGVILEQMGGGEVDCPGFGEVTALHVAVMQVVSICYPHLI